jgi:NitT/TauT family transport system ATP-binding protein
MLVIKKLTFAYRGGPAIFKDFDLEVHRGEAWTVIGPSGCGKTTLLYILAGLLRPGDGEITIDGLHISGPRPKTGLVLQDHGLLPWATVRKNVRLGLTIREFYGPDGRHAPSDENIDADAAEERVNHWLGRLGISGLEDRFPSQLSRGQRQRTAIARTLVLEPDLILMDEPFSALDAPTREDLQRVLLGFNRDSGLTTIFVTHDIEEAVVVGEKILVLWGRSNLEPRIIQNELAGRPDDRNAPAFRKVREELRALLENLS